MTSARLIVDIERRRSTFNLVVQMAVNTEILVLFGPSGSGKTTTLNAIAGLVRPDAGEIILDGTPFLRRGRPGPAVDLPTRRRRVGYVFQQYALFPHLTAAENVAYGLWRQPEARRQAQAWLERVGIAHLADRYPSELSGGQQQRVAIARALVTAPPVLLLDEPFSALDAAVRERLQRDLAALQAELGLVVLYVTHRLEDAFAVGHRLAIVREGRVEQVGPIDEVAGRPTSAAVAALLGIRNLFAARVAANGPDGLVLDWEGLTLAASPQPATVGTLVTAYIRPEDIKVLYPDRPAMRAVRHNQVQGTIVASRRRAHARTLTVVLAANGHEVEIEAPGYAYAEMTLLPGEAIQLALRKEALIVLQTAPNARPAAAGRSGQPADRHAQD